VPDKYRYLIKSLPELSLFSSDDERKQALRQARLATTPVRGTLASALLSAIGGGLLVWAIFIVFPALPVPPWLGGAVIGGVTGATISLFWARAARPRLRRSLREQLVDKGVPVCLECGYDLRGQLDARCPECSTPFDEKLLRESPAERGPGGSSE